MVPLPYPCFERKLAQTEASGLAKRLANLKPYKPGQNHHTTKRERLALKFGELERAYFPNGGANVMDATRLRLAAQHLIDAERCSDAVTRQRATRCAELLLSKLTPPPAAIGGYDYE